MLVLHSYGIPDISEYRNSGMTNKDRFLPFNLAKISDSKCRWVREKKDLKETDQTKTFHPAPHAISGVIQISEPNIPNCELHICDNNHFTKAKNLY